MSTVGRAGRLGRDADPARLVGPAGHARRELVGAVAGEHEVRVAVDEAGDDAAAVGVEALVGVERPAAPTATTRSPSIATAASRRTPSGPSPSSGSLVTSRPMRSTTSVLTIAAP